MSLPLHLSHHFNYTPTSGRSNTISIATVTFLNTVPILVCETLECSPLSADPWTPRSAPRTLRTRTTRLPSLQAFDTIRANLGMGDHPKIFSIRLKSELDGTNWASSYYVVVALSSSDACDRQQKLHSIPQTTQTNVWASILPNKTRTASPPTPRAV
jgi:hypothetical protein